MAKFAGGQLKSMKLLFCIDHFGPGGAQRQLVNLAKGLHGRGHTVEFFIYQPLQRHFADEVEELGIEVHAHSKSHKLSPLPVIKLARLIRRGGFDGVLSFLQTPAVYAELATLANRGVPLVVSERFMYTEMDIYTRGRQELHRLSTWITVNSHHQRERMEQLFPWMRPRISTIYNGVDLERFAPREPGFSGMSDEPLSLLAVANTARKKNAMGLARALSAIRAAGHALPTVAWAGASADAAEAVAKSEVEDYLRAEGLAANWTWLGRRTDVADLMRQYDALVHPAHFEGLPNAICEALASGLPVLASAVCDHPRLVGEDRGFLFDPGAPDRMADAMLTFQDLPEQERRAMGQRARMFAEEHLSLQRYVRDYEELFARLARVPTRAASAGAEERAAH